ncbi:MAG: FMN-binding protein [Candidatus Neomarinimicrobiota bacterium]|jgi:uncharacterized protein with FMN-binding domain|nr:FMN-binding protein [Candidatus Neomarinimicrobiota bacterium]MDX9780694.1 FMN-binding protein [bacterium]
MKRIAQNRILILLCAFTLFLTSCKNNELDGVRKIAINAIDLSQIRNGNYRGNFSYGDFTCVVEEFVSNTRIETINILENRDSEYAKMAEGVAEKVLRRQGNDVDVVSAATATSKALLKAVENALRSQSYQ